MFNALKSIQACTRGEEASWDVFVEAPAIHQLSLQIERDLKKLKMQSEITLEGVYRYYTGKVILQFSKNEKLLFHGCTMYNGNTLLEMWQVEPLQLLFRDISKKKGSLRFHFEVSCKILIVGRDDDQHLSTEIRKWKIISNEKNKGHLEEIEVQFISDLWGGPVCFSDAFSLIAAFSLKQLGIEFYGLDLKKINSLKVDISSFEGMTFYEEGNPLLVMDKGKLSSIMIEENDSALLLKKTDLDQSVEEIGKIFEIKVIPNTSFLLCLTDSSADYPGVVSIRDMSSNFTQIARINYSNYWLKTNAILSDGEKLFKLSGNVIEISPIDENSLEEIIPLGHAIDQVQFSSDGEMLFLSIGKQLYTYDVWSGRMVDIKKMNRNLRFFLNKENRYTQEDCFATFVNKRKPFLIDFDKFYCHLSSDQQYLLKIHKDRVELWRMADRKMIDEAKLTLENPDLYDIVCSNYIFPLTHLSISTFSEILVWELNWEKKVFQKIEKLVLGHENQFISTKQLFSLREDGKLFFWDSGNRKSSKVPIKKQINHYQVSEDGRWLVFLRDINAVFSRLILYDLKKKCNLDKYTIPPLKRLKISRDGKFVVSWNQSLGKEMYLWKIEGGKLKLLWKIPHTMELTNISFKSPKNLDHKNRQILKEHIVNYEATSNMTVKKAANMISLS